MPEQAQRTLSGPEKAAVLLLALGAERSAQLLAALTQQEIELLAAHLARTNHVDPEIRSQVLGEYRAASSLEAAPEGGLAYARELLSRALGAERAAAVISRVELAAEGADLRLDSEPEADRLGRLLRGQHPQLCAAVLSRLPPAMAARALACLPRDARLAVAIRLVGMDPPHPEACRRLAQALRTSLLADRSAPAGPAEGPRRLAEILNSADREVEQGLLADLHAHDPTLARQVRERMFTFEDLEQLEPRELQLVLRNVSQEDLRMALQTAGEKLKQYIFANMSERAAAALKEDMESAGPVKPQQSYAAQQRVAAVARQLAKEGTLLLKSQREDQEEVVEEEPQPDEHVQRPADPSPQEMTEQESTA